MFWSHGLLRWLSSKSTISISQRKILLRGSAWNLFLCHETCIYCTCYFESLVLQESVSYYKKQSSHLGQDPITKGSIPIAHVGLQMLEGRPVSPVDINILQIPLSLISWSGQSGMPFEMMTPVMSWMGWHPRNIFENFPDYQTGLGSSTLS